jgi:mannobiose 2-epimerase
MYRGIWARAFLAILTFMSASVSLWAQGGRGLRQDWPVVFRDTLQLKILPFWLDHATDQQEGGLLGRLDRQGIPIPPGNKSVVLIARSLWSFSEAYRRYPEPAYQKLAAECLRFLRQKMWDRESGGYYFLVSREGRVIDSSKQLNPMSYAMEGLAEYALAFHGPQARREALDLWVRSRLRAGRDQRSLCRS